MLFSLLARSTALASLDDEGHLLWNVFHGDDLTVAGPTASGLDAVAPGERRALPWMIHRIAGDRRYLDKTPRNSLRVPYLLDLFPDASFVFLARDGRATVSSLMNAWREAGGMFPGRRAPVPIRIEGYHGDRWKFVAPPGWQSYASGHTLAEVCAFQWTACMEAILDARHLVDDDRWVQATYEGLTSSPVEETSRLLERLGLPLDDDVLDHARTLDREVTKATSAPRPDKWRDENGPQIERILPLIAPTMRRLGYEA
jgi:hypothetical protein